MEAVTVARSGRALRFSNPAWMPGLLSRVLTSSVDSGGMVAMLEQDVLFAGIGPRHTHRSEDELIYVLDGELRVRLNGTTVQLSTGMVLVIPRNCEHTVLVDAEQTMVLTLYLPGGFERMLEELELDVASIVHGAQTYAVPSEQLIAMAARYDCEIISPPQFRYIRPAFVAA